VIRKTPKHHSFIYDKPISSNFIYDNMGVLCGKPNNKLSPMIKSLWSLWALRLRHLSILKLV
jgi:hypothetical protein